MRRSELHDDLLNNILVFLQLAVNGKTDNIFLMVSLRVCATAANKHKIWIKSSNKKRLAETQITIMYQCRIIPSNNHACIMQLFRPCNLQELCMHTVAAPTNLPCIHIGVVLLL